MVVVLLVLAIPLWPVALAVLAAALVATWPLEQLLGLVGLRLLRGASARLGIWLRWMSAPWNWFDMPAKSAPPEEGEQEKL